MVLGHRGPLARILLPSIAGKLGFSLPSHGSHQGLCVATLWASRPLCFPTCPVQAQLLASPLAEVLSAACFWLGYSSDHRALWAQ